jgi:hypothetical protein
MNNEKLNEMLKQLGGEKPPEDVHKLAEEISRRSVDVLSFPQVSTFGRVRISLFRFSAAAAVIIFVFTFGFYIGKQSSPSQFQISSFNSGGFCGQYPQNETHKLSSDGFWRRKALALMQPKSRSQIEFSKVGILQAYRQYIQEKYND